MKLKSMTAEAIVFSFEGLADLVFDPRKASAECEQHAMLMGYQASIRDTAALSRKQKDGSVVTVTEEMRRAEAEARIAYLESGATEWTQRGGPRAAPQNPVILAIAAKRGCTYAEAEAWLASDVLAGIGQ